MQKEISDKIIYEAKKIEIDKHPGFRDIIAGCIDWGLNLENASILVEDNKIIFNEELPEKRLFEDALTRHSRNVVIIINEGSNIKIVFQKIYKDFKFFKHDNGRNLIGPEQEYLGFVEIRTIDENGIEIKRTQEKRNIDSVVVERTNAERRGIRNVYYTKDMKGKRVKAGIGVINLIPEHHSFFQKLDYVEAPENDVIVEQVIDEILNNCFKNLTEKQKYGLMQLENSNFVSYIIEDIERNTKSNHR